MIHFDGTRQRWVVDISRRVNGQRIRKQKILPKGSSREQALAVAERLDADAFTRAVAIEGTEGWDAYVKALEADPRSWLFDTLKKAKSRSRRVGRVCDLTPQELAFAMRRSKGRCEVTGMRFTTYKPGSSKTRPYVHSIDRIECSRGYTADNIRIVCLAVNIAMSHWGEALFAEFACGYVFNKFSAINLMRHAEAANNLPTFSAVLEKG